MSVFKKITKKVDELSNQTFFFIMALLFSIASLIGFYELSFCMEYFRVPMQTLVSMGIIASLLFAFLGMHSSSRNKKEF